MIYQSAEKASKFGCYALILFIDIKSAKMAGNWVVNTWKTN